MKQPLNRIKVLIPRPIEQSNEFAEKLEKLGAVPIIFPLIEVKPINKTQLLEIYSKNNFDWLIFTSGVAVKCFFDVINPKDVTSKIAAVGSQTKKTIEKLGLKVNFIPSAATAQKLAKEIPIASTESVFIPQSKIANNTIVEILGKKNISIKTLATYDNSPVEYTKEQIEEVLKTPINVITFTSGSTVNSFMDLIKKHKIKLDAVHTVSIGPSTTAEAQKRYLEIDATAEDHSIDGIIDEILKFYI